MTRDSHNPKNIKTFLCQSILSILHQKTILNTKGLRCQNPIIWDPLFPVNGSPWSLRGFLYLWCWTTLTQLQLLPIPSPPSYSLIQSLGKRSIFKKPYLLNMAKNLHSKLIALDRSVEEKYSKFCKHCQSAPTLKSRLSSSTIQESSIHPTSESYPEMGIYFLSSTSGPGTTFLS